MAKAPASCPVCGEKYGWKIVDSGSKGFSFGKAVAGAVLVGPVGLVGGALGKKKATYFCKKCNFQHDYDL